MTDQYFYDKLLGNEEHWSKFEDQELPAQPLANLPTSSLLDKVAPTCPYDQDQINRFESKIRVRDDGCWEWTASKHSKVNPIGRFVIRKSKYEGSNQAAYKIYKGPIPDGYWVVRVPSCSMPGCCNPDCLEAVPAKKCSANTMARGTFQPVTPGFSELNPKRRGEAVHGSKLAVKDVLFLRIEYAKGDCSYRDLARSYGVDVQAVRRAVIGEHWKHLPMDIGECKRRLSLLGKHSGSDQKNQLAENTTE